MGNVYLSRRGLLRLAGAAGLLGPFVSYGRGEGAAMLPDSLRHSIDRFALAYVAAMNAPGLTLAVAAADVQPYLAAYGVADLGTRARITSHQLFQIGSISKSFAALILLQMQDEGRLALGDSIVSRLPWLEIEEPFGTVTLHHLLTHSSGFAEGMPLFPRDGKPRRPAFAPGSKFHYSNWGFDVLGRLIEAIEGKTYAEVLAARIFAPLGMNDSFAAITSACRSRMVASYVPRDDDRPYPRRGALVPAGPLVVTGAAGCVAASSRDMAKYLKMLASGGVAPRGRLVSPRAFEALITPHIRAPEFGPTASYGYGVAVDTLNGDRVLRHTGGMVSFMSSIQVNLDAGNGAFASINAQQDYRPNAVTQYSLRVLQAFHRHRPLPPAPPPTEGEPPHDPTEFAGTYVAEDGRRLLIDFSRAGLMLSSERMSARLQHLEGDAFLTAEPGWELFPLVFERAPHGTGDGPGRIVGVGHGASWFVREGVPADTASSAEELHAYEGVYYSEDPWVGTVRFVARRGRLWLNGMTPLEATAARIFRFADEPSSPETAEFSNPVGGRSQVVSLSGNYLNRISG